MKTSFRKEPTTYIRTRNTTMSENGPKVQFALGSQVSQGHFFKSSFARSLVTNCRDAESLNLEFLDNGTVTEQTERTNDRFNDGKNNNEFVSLINFGVGSGNDDSSSGPRSSTWQTFNRPESSNEDIGEMDKLRKQCQTLRDENRRLAESLRINQVPHVQVIDNVFLQTQIDILQWQLKQTESNRQMYRSVMGQVLRFLQRTQKSLEPLQEKSPPKGKTLRVPRSRSVHATEQDNVVTSSPLKRNSIADSAASTCSNVTSSRLGNGKSVAQAAPQATGRTSLREFTRSVLRRNDPTYGTPPRDKPPSDRHRGLDQTHDSVVYRRPKQQTEVDPDSVPPEKLSKEAFRLMRTVQSLLTMREPDLAMVSSNDEDSSSSPLEHDLSSLQIDNFANSTTLHESPRYNGGCSSSDRGSTESGAESERTSFIKSTSTVIESTMSNSGTLRSLLPGGGRRMLDATSFASILTSDKTIERDREAEAEEEEEEEEDIRRTDSTASSPSTVSSRDIFLPNREVRPRTTLIRRGATKLEKKHGSPGCWSKMKLKPATSVSSAEDESGFSSMSSFQEVGLPVPFATRPIDPLKAGCHTEIGLPKVPVEEIRHRRWSSTPVELKRHSMHFTNPPRSSDLPSVWV